jgi:thiol-disulfide isomerase/thioredoxin
VVAIVQTGEKHGQVQIGTLVELGDVWRVIDLPEPITEGQKELASAGYFFRAPAETQAAIPTTGPSEKAQELLTQLEKLDATAAQAVSPQDQAKFNARRADLLQQIIDQAETPEERAMWIRQLADMVSAAVQSNAYPNGAKRLASLFEKLRKSPKDKELAGYVRFRQLTADYGLAIRAKDADFVKVQADWLKKLEQYIAAYPSNPDAAEAMLQLAIAQEFAGQEAAAKKWYGKIVSQFPSSPAAKKAAGARTRLDSVGKTITVKGKNPSGGEVDLAAYRGKVVLIQYWASWCEPCKADMATLKDLLTRYGKAGFNVIGVNLDASLQEMKAYLAENPLPWNQIFEEGGLDSRPANELGILTLPTMILVDQKGKVVHRNVHVVELDRELKKLIR